MARQKPAALRGSFGTDKSSKVAVWAGPDHMPPPLNLPANQSSARVMSSMVGKWMDYKQRLFPPGYAFRPQDLWNFVWFELFRNKSHFTSAQSIVNYFCQAYNHEMIHGKLHHTVQWTAAKALIMRRIKQYAVANSFCDQPPEQAPPLRTEFQYKLANCTRVEQAMLGAMIQSGFRSGVWKRITKASVSLDTLGEHVAVTIRDDKNEFGTRTVLLVCSCVHLDQCFGTNRGKHYCPRHSNFQEHLPFQEARIHDLARRVTGQDHRRCGHSFRVTWNCCFARALGSPTLEAYDAFVRAHPMLRHNLMTQNGWSPTSVEFVKYARNYATTSFLPYFYASQFFYVIYNVIIWSPRVLSLMATNHHVGKEEVIKRFLMMSDAIPLGSQSAGHSDMTAGTMLDQAARSRNEFGAPQDTKPEVLGVPVPPVLTLLDADRLVQNAAIVVQLRNAPDNPDLRRFSGEASPDVRAWRQQKTIEEVCDQIDPTGGAASFFAMLVERTADPSAPVSSLSKVTTAVRVSGIKYPVRSLGTFLDPHTVSSVGLPAYAAPLPIEVLAAQNKPPARRSNLHSLVPPDRAWDEFNLNRPPVCNRAGSAKRTRDQWRTIALRAAEARAKGFQLLTTPTDARQMHSGKFAVDPATGKYRKRDVELQPQQKWQDVLMVDPIFLNLKKADAVWEKSKSLTNPAGPGDSVEDEDDLFQDPNVPLQPDDLTGVAMPESIDAREHESDDDQMSELGDVEMNESNDVEMSDAESSDQI